MTELGFNAALWAGRATLFGALLWAVYTDSRERRIRNDLTLTLLLSGLLWHVTMMDGVGLFDPTSSGGLGFKMSALGAAAAFAAFFPLYLFKLFGAGDVKLLVAVGAWVGLPGLLPVTLLILICGGALALARILDPARRARTLVNLRIIGLQFMGVGAAAGAGFDPKTDSADGLPYAWAILFGTAIYALARFGGWWRWM